MTPEDRTRLLGQIKGLYPLASCGEECQVTYPHQHWKADLMLHGKPGVMIFPVNLESAKKRESLDLRESLEEQLREEIVNILWGVEQKRELEKNPLPKPSNN